MATPKRYERGYSFSGFQANSPNKPLPGPNLDTELENVEASINSAIDGINDLRRADGALKNGIVTKDALAPGLSTGVDPATEWVAGIAYSANNVVFHDAAFYRCSQSHTSSDFVADLASGYWEVFADFTPYFTGVEQWRDEAVAAAADASADAAAASASASSATSSASSASTSATAAAGSASSAAATYDLFDDRYLGEKTSLPTLDNDGNALVNGALVSLTGQVDVTMNGMYVRRGGVWQAMFAPTAVWNNMQTMTATSGQTSFAVPGGYIAGYALVFLNGMKLVNGVDVDVSSGSNVVLATGASAGDVVDVQGFRVLDVGVVDGSSILSGTVTEQALAPGAAENAVLFSAPKPFARSWAEAVAMCDDHSEMRGYAALAGTTGGAGKTTYKVFSAKDDATEGTLRWAVAQAITNGGGRIIFAPVGIFTINLKTLLNISGNNITVDAPGRNVRIFSLNNVEMIRLSGQNIIFRRVVLGRLPHYTHVDGDNIYERDGLSVVPTTADKVWIDQCTLTEHSDGALDCASSALVPASSPVRITVSRCLFRRQDKTSAWGSSATSIDPAPAWAANALAETPVLFATFDRNVFDGCAQRSPRVGALCFIHKINNIHKLAAYRRDDGTTSAIYASVATTGGKIRSEGDYVRLSCPTTGANGIYAETTAWDDALNVGPGAARIIGSVAEDGLSMSEANTGSVPTPAYSASVITIPADAAGRAAFEAAIFGGAGAEVCNLSDKEYAFVAKAEGDADGLYADGYHVVSVPGGYRVRVQDNVPAPNVDPPEELAPTRLTLARGSTAVIASGVITAPVGTSIYFAVDTEGAAATDDLVTINGGASGDVIGIRSATTARVVTLKTGGNIRVPGDVPLSAAGDTCWLINENGFWYVISSPSSVAGTYTPICTSVANLDAAPTVAGACWRKTGNIVSVTGTVTADATAAADVQFKMSLPIPSNLAAASDLSGMLVAYRNGAIAGGAIIGSASDDTALARLTAVSVSATDYTFNFTYQIK